MTQQTRRDELAGFLEEAHLRVSDGSRPISEPDARGLADEILFGDGAPEWIHHVSPAEWAARVLASHQVREYVEGVVESGPWGTWGWVCECGTVITAGDLTVPAGMSVPQGHIWMARHQAAMLAGAKIL